VLLLTHSNSLIYLLIYPLTLSTRTIALDPPLLPSQVKCVLLLTHFNSLIYSLIYTLTHSTYTIALDPPLLPSQVGCLLLLTHSNSIIYPLTLTHSSTHVSTHSREVGGWGRDPKKCTGRDWGMGSSTI